jgi:hypothetical protein
LLARAWCISAQKYCWGTPKIIVPRGGWPPDSYISEKLRARAIFWWSWTGDPSTVGQAFNHWITGSYSHFMFPSVSAQRVFNA